MRANDFLGLERVSCGCEQKVMLPVRGKLGIMSWKKSGP